MMTIGKRIAWLRERLGYTMSELARRSDMPVQQLNDLEKGDSDVRVSTLLKVAKGLGLPLGVFTVGLDPEYDLMIFARDLPRHVAELQSLSYDRQTRQRLLSPSENPNNSTATGESANVAPAEPPLALSRRASDRELDPGDLVSVLLTIQNLIRTALGRNARKQDSKGDDSVSGLGQGPGDGT
jgi:transcriptional regulator with XRE-family HTH domain